MTDYSIPTSGYSGSDRAKKAVSSAMGKSPMVGESPMAKATQTDIKKTPADVNNSLKQDTKPRVLKDMVKPAKGALSPNLVNPMQRVK